MLPCYQSQMKKIQSLKQSPNRQMPAAKAARMAIGLALNIDTVTRQIIAWKLELPSVNLNSMIEKWPELLYIPADQIPSIVQEVRELMCDPQNFEEIVQIEPRLFDLDFFKQGVQQHNLLYGDKSNIVNQLQRTPGLLDSLVPLTQQSRGERDEEYLQSLFQAEG
eukprot:TRINITY_DN11632_c0_g1_i2.p1 TRINITY_DN11632_c0_g1~~TRINITY_DN11632_c0_g1_i2.p1  ORF type:complete len:165 (-),score=20.48 TRINITY_DN11632_c0_g1_i2:68-562(-)